MAVLLNTIGVTYAKLGEDSRAIEYYLKALVFEEELGNERRIALVLYNIGRSHQANRKPKQALKSLKDKIRHKFNVSVAEIGCLDKWQRHTLAVCCVNSDKKLLNSILSKVKNLVDAQGSIELIDYTIDFC